MENTITTNTEIDWQHSPWLGTWAFIGQYKIVKLAMGGYLVHRCDSDRMPVDVGTYLATEEAAIGLATGCID